MNFHYNRFAASYYAQQHANTGDYSPDWIRATNDCTNFVSQALLAGGWDMIHGEKHDSTAWYAMGVGGLLRSYTWGGADFFAKFLRRSGRAFACSKELLSLGDIVQLTDSQGTAVHTMLVSSLDRGECRLSYHTKDRKDIPMSTFATLTSENIVYWKVMDAFPPTLGREVPGYSLLTHFTRK